MMKNTKKEAQAAHCKAVRAALKLPAYSDARRDAFDAADQAYSNFIRAEKQSSKEEIQR